MKKLLRNIYGKARNSMPASLQGYISKMVFSMAGKPFVKTDDLAPPNKFPNGEKGGLIISADFEMSWAWRYSKGEEDYIQKGRTERENFPRIIAILEAYEIPITFATVGHLFLEGCKQGEHDWMARIPYFDDHWRFMNGDWFDHDPYSDYKSAPEWYAPDLIRMIQKSKLDHEVGCHTFTHIDVSNKNCPSKVADDELKACIDAAKPYGVDLKSIVFPGGTWGSIEALKKYGIEIYRRNVDFDLAYPYRDEHGLLVTPSSGSLEHNLEYGWKPDYFLKRLKKSVNKAIGTNTIAHLWFHPSLNPYFLENIFPGFLSYAAEQRKKGDLWIGTMKDIALHIDENRVL